MYLIVALLSLISCQYFKEMEERENRIKNTVSVTETPPNLKKCMKLGDVFAEQNINSNLERTYFNLKEQTFSKGGNTVYIVSKNPRTIHRTKTISQVEETYKDNNTRADKVIEKNKEIIIPETIYDFHGVAYSCP